MTQDFRMYKNNQKLRRDDIYAKKTKCKGQN